MLTEAETRRIIGAAGAVELIKIVQGGWDQYRAEGHQLGRRARAAVLFDYMCSRSSDLAAMEGVRRAEVYTSPVFVLRAALGIRFKKHDRSLLTSNLRTKTQITLDSQGAFPGLAGIPMLTVGYVLDRAEASIERIVAARIVHRQVEFYVDLPDLAAGEQRPLAPTLPIGPFMPQLPAIAVRRREVDGTA